MANYDRRILVPYLENLCCVELAYAKLDSQWRKVEAEYRECDGLANAKITKPFEPEKDFEFGEGFLIGILLAVISIFIIIIKASSGVESGNFIWIGLLFVAALLSIGSLVMSWVNSETNYEEQRVEYKKQMKIYDDRLQVAIMNSALADKIRIEKNNIQIELNKLTNLKQKMYASNIIPKRYRNLEAVCYLYDYFSTSRETDLEKIIQTMILDRIDNKMSEVIDRLDKIILNQKIQIQEQRIQKEMIEKNHLEQMAAIARLEENQELQTEYLSMIEASAAADAYFSAAVYFQKT